ncbi:MAG: hypothetical protein QY316_00175 [Thermodesulfobacteriota bacterium]|nr:MAG: hypothetical protein QY316_00175 [Thermodesulfobacteriota bacterium]
MKSDDLLDGLEAGGTAVQAGHAEEGPPGKTRPARFEDQENYFLNWLTATPAQMRTLKSLELDPERRHETVLASLLRERSRNVVPFRPVSRKTRVDTE